MEITGILHVFDLPSHFEHAQFVLAYATPLL